ncbi:hypothetical protein ACFSYD_06110 [Paracoccus aerius]
MTDIHEGLPELPLSTVSPDGSGILLSNDGAPKVVTSGSADDPLAAALAGPSTRPTPPPGCRRRSPRPRRPVTAAPPVRMMR